MPHAPQFAGSFRGSTQPAPHASNGAAHALEHTPSTQMPTAQSVLRSHPPPLGHAAHEPPPQSTPVSGPFSIPSLQVGAAQ